MYENLGAARVSLFMQMGAQLCSHLHTHYSIYTHMPNPSASPNAHTSKSSRLSAVTPLAMSAIRRQHLQRHTQELRRCQPGTRAGVHGCRTTRVSLIAATVLPRGSLRGRWWHKRCRGRGHSCVPPPSAYPNAHTSYVTHIPNPSASPNAHTSRSSRLSAVTPLATSAPAIWARCSVAW
jgi:hypothetical protein